MTGLDASFYLLEDENTPLHVASVIVFEGPAPTYGDVIREIVAKLPKVPRYRQRVRPVPLQLGRPVWVDDPHFQVLYHVRHTAVPEPGTDEQLRNLAGRVLAQRLDPAKPLWEMWLVEGLADGRWALIVKIHHCMVDGVAGINLATVLFDLSPEHRTPEPTEQWRPEREPSPAGLLLDAAVRSVTVPVRRLNRLAVGAVAAVGAAGAAGPRRAVSPRGAVNPAGAAGTAGGPRVFPQPNQVRAFAAGLGRTTARFTRPSAGSLNGPIGPHRRWCWQDADLAEIKQIRKAFDGTVNDVVLAAVTRGFRDQLNARGELTGDTVVRTAVPVSVRTTDETGELTNRVAAFFVNLPVGEDDALGRLDLIRAQMDDVKRSRQEVGTKGITKLTDAAVAPALLSLAARTPVRLRNPVVQTITTNVPGPPFPLYVLGRRVLAMRPYVPITGGIRVATAIVSYCGTLHFGLTGDFDSMPDLDVLAKGIRAGFDELSGLADTG